MSSATTPPPEPSEIVLLEVLLVRSILERANEAARPAGAVDSMTAMLLADLAVETLTKLVLRELGGRGGDSLHENVNHLRELASTVPEPMTRAVSRLRSVRNQVQHDGLSPHPGETATFLRDASDYCMAVANEILHIDLHRLSTANLVHDPFHRAFLTQALSHRVDNNLREALIFASAAFESLRLRWAVVVRDVGEFDTRLEGYISQIGSSAVLTACRALRIQPPRAWEPNDHKRDFSMFARVTLGFPIPELARVTPLVRTVERHLNSDNVPLTPSAEDVDFVIEAIARQCWRLEQLHPDLYGPGSVEVAPAPDEEPAT